MKGKICNQLFVKDTFRDRQYKATVRCVWCDESSNLEATYPFELKLITDFLSNFMKLHKQKGCNARQLSTPIWASKEVDLGLSM